MESDNLPACDRTRLLQAALNGRETRGHYFQDATNGGPAQWPVAHSRNGRQISDEAMMLGGGEQALCGGAKLPCFRRWRGDRALGACS